MTMEPMAAAAEASDAIERMLGGLVLPDAVVATKSSSASESWMEGAARSLRHDCWLVCSDDRARRKDAEFIVPFDGVVDAGGLLLSDPAARADALTKRIVCVSALTIGFRRSALCAQATFKIAQSLDWYLRWRRGLGIASNAAVEPRHFEDFLACLGGGMLSLVPVVERLDVLAARAVEGKFALPIWPADPDRVDWTALARELGVGVRALSKSHGFRAELVDRLPLLAPLAAPRLAERIGEEVSAEPPEERGVRSAEGLLEAWECLAHLSATGFLSHDPLGFDPFADRTRRMVAATIGRPKGRTETLPPEDLLRLMDAAAKWVLDFADPIRRALDLMRDRKALPSAGIGCAARRRAAMAEFDAAAPAGLPPILLSWRNDPVEGEEGRISVTDAVKHLMAACAILIGGFGARRIGEIMSLRAGCLAEERPGLFELTIHIEKTLRAADRIPVPAMVKAAVAVLEDLSESTRAAAGEDWLFEVHRLNGSERRIHFKLDAVMNTFAELHRLPLPAGWDAWRLKPHQLRRGFAVCYYHGFAAASLDALSRFLRHFDPEMTRIYINEAIAGSMGRLREEIGARTKEAAEAMGPADRRWIADAKRLLEDVEARGAAFEEVRCEALVHRMLALWDGSDRAIGQGGARLRGDLESMVERASSAVRLGGRSNAPEALRPPLMEALREYARSHRIEPVPGATHCTCRPDVAEDLDAAECLKEKRAGQPPWRTEASPPEVRPDHAFAGCSACLGCRHVAAFEEDRPRIAAVGTRLEDAAARAGTDAARAAAAAKLERFKAALRTAESAATRRGA